MLHSVEDSIVPGLLVESNSQDTAQTHLSTVEMIFWFGFFFSLERAIDSVMARGSLSGSVLGTFGQIDRFSPLSPSSLSDAVLTQHDWLYRNQANPTTTPLEALDLVAKKLLILVFIDCYLVRLSLRIRGRGKERK